MFTGDCFAATSSSESVDATIGSLKLSISGFIAPYASVVLTSDSIFLASTVADANGNFSFSDVVVNSGFSGYCFDAIDQRRLGESYTCFGSEPVTSNTSITGIFLPPTLGVQREEIQLGNNAMFWGYSMPFATIILHISDGSDLHVNTDKSGYYQTTVLLRNTGSYQISAEGIYNNQLSAKPDKSVSIRVLGVTQSLINKSKNAIQIGTKALSGYPLGILWLAIPLLLIIAFLTNLYLNTSKWVRNTLELDWYLDMLKKYTRRRSKK